MFRQRALVSLIFTPLAFWLIYVGGLPLFLVLTFLLGVAGWEFASLFRAGGFRPAGFLLVGGIVVFQTGRYLGILRGEPFAYDSLFLAGILFAVMAASIVGFERGNLRGGTDMLITFGGIFYVGFLGSYLLALRALPDGAWWFMVTLPAVWLIDSGAYLFGRRWGGLLIRRKFSPRLSPNKTWEGFLGGIVSGTLGNALLCVAIQAVVGPPIAPTPWTSAILGFLLALLTPLGDLGKSMFKRQVGVKDSGRLIPGHGGALDRMDTWLWAGVISYYVISWFF
ncbi:MAG: phosphatidate cytidylyltransferase [Anaerolineales bacterium]